MCKIYKGCEYKIMYKNIKLIEEFEQELIKKLLKEDIDEGFDFDNEDPEVVKEKPNDEDLEKDDVENLEESGIRKIIKDLEAELDLDDDEDFDGDGEDDIDPDELDNMYLGADEEIKELSDEDELDNLVDDKKVLEEEYIDFLLESVDEDEELDDEDEGDDE